MNLQALQNKVIEKLKERSTPKHWTLSEITDNINRGCRKFAGDSRAQEKRLPIYPVDISNGMFAFPNRLLNQSGVYWDNIKLDMVDSNHMDNLYSSNPQSMVIGDSPNGITNWRSITADAPTKWLIEDGMIRVYPLPNSMTSAASLRSAEETTLSIGSTDIVLTGPIPSDKNLIDVYLNGVYYNMSDWEILNSTTIRLNFTPTWASDVEVVYFDGVTTGTTKMYKYNFTMLAGASNIVMPRPYALGDNAVSVKVNGVSIAPSTFTESSTLTITLNTALTYNAVVEVTLYERIGAFPATMKCCTIPTEMVLADDVPDLPGHLEDYHDAIWQWALAECYSRESQEKNMAMAQFYGAMYESKLQDYKSTFHPAILIAPRDAWRI